MASMSILTASQVSDSIWHTILSRIKIRTIRKVNKKDYFHKNQKGRFIFYIFFKAVHTIFLFFLVFESGQDFFFACLKIEKMFTDWPFFKSQYRQSCLDRFLNDLSSNQLSKTCQNILWKFCQRCQRIYHPMGIHHYDRQQGPWASLYDFGTET